MPKFKTVETEFEGYPVTVPVIPNLAQLILEEVQKAPERFDMGSWHCKIGNDDEMPGPKDYKKCGFFLRAFAKALRIQPPNGCFISRETQEISIPRSCAKPLHAVFPNYASCLESYTAYVQSGESPTFCRPTESR